MTALATLHGVSKAFGPLTAVDDVTVEIRAGECVGLLGPNGAGKTTVLSMLLGLRRPSAGTVRLFDGDPADARSRLRLGSTPQQSAFPESLRVCEALEFAAAHYPAPMRVDAILDEFGLTPKARASCGSLSGGWQRRLAVAMAFVGDPQLVLLDEPTTGLDLEARAQLWAALRARHAAGCTILVTSHHLDEIEALAQRVVVMDRGHILADDALASILDRVAMRHVTLRGVEPETLRRLDPAATATTADDGQVTVLTPDADRFVRELVGAGAPFTDLSVRGATLEEAFLAITKGH